MHASLTSPHGPEVQRRSISRGLPLSAEAECSEADGCLRRLKGQAAAADSALAAVVVLAMHFEWRSESG